MRSSRDLGLDLAILVVQPSSRVGGSEQRENGPLFRLT